MDAFFEPLGPGRYRATEHTAGPWDPRHQHAGPPAALLGSELEALVPDDDALLARVTIEILGPIPVGEVEVQAREERPGRSVALLSAELRAGGRAVIRARAWRVRRADAPATAVVLPAPIPQIEGRLNDGVPDFGYGRAIEWRPVGYAAGAGTVWTRLKVATVAGREPTPLERVLAVADSASGVATALPWETHLFVNTELTVHVLRPVRGDWVCLDARTEIGDAGLATSVLSDTDGIAARGAQSLLIAPR
jgi:acyl-coenzyme A thioesterase PaaI-like protein